MINEIRDAENWASKEVKKYTTLESMVKEYYRLFYEEEKNIYTEALQNELECEIRHINNGKIPNDVLQLN